MKKDNIGILTFPIVGSGIYPTSNLIEVIRPFSKDIYLVTGNAGYKFFKTYKNIHTFGTEHEKAKNGIKRIINYVLTQVRLSYFLFILRNNVDIYIFFIGGDGLILPMICAKMLNKKVISSPADNTLMIRKDLLSRMLMCLERINRMLSNCIVLHSAGLMDEWNLRGYSEKICIAHEYFIDLEKFKIEKKYRCRKNIIGYIGRLSDEKGILNFVKAISKLLKNRDNLEFLIGGEGELKDEIKSYINKYKLNSSVKLVGWIPHDELASQLNELKLLVIPSYIESGPIIALEAMACGTPILGTRVGHVLNLLTDEETAFIMENNSPGCIKENVERALDYSDIKKIVENGRNLVKREFTYEIAVESYRKVLENY